MAYGRINYKRAEVTDNVCKILKAFVPGSGA